jgi:uncharacterized cupin superfamily protein
MHRINLADISSEESASPKGRFRRVRLNIAAALAAKRNGTVAADQCPFEVELVRVPPRAANWPYHAHSAQWEFYLIISGRGQVRTPQGQFDVREGDCVLHPPGEAHHLTNTGAADLMYYVIADNPPCDACHYPDSGKWMLPQQSKPVRLQPVNYYDGEE